jgi:DNA-binding HxlR family transcriptional regulator
MVAKKEHKKLSGCPVACGLDIVGDHWTLLIIRDLMFKDIHEYKDMLAAREQISSNILTVRLKKLEQEELVSSIPHPENKRRKLYYLTAKGKDLIYVLVSLMRWSNTHLNDQLFIPEKKQKMLETNVDQFIQKTLKHLEEWEKVHL